MGADRKCKSRNYEMACVLQHRRLQNPASRLIGDWFAIEPNICCIRIGYSKRMIKIIWHDNHVTVQP